MAERSPLGPLQQAVYTWLANDPALAALAKVYDQVPQSTTFPYVEIGELSSVRDPTLGRADRLATVTVFAWSQAFGYKQLEDILEELLRLLDEEDIPNTSAAMDPSLGWQVAYNLVNLEEVSRLPDGITRQLAVRCQILTQKIDQGE